MMEQILKDAGVKFTEAWGEAAFYGPKLDVQGYNVHGKEDTLFTVQIDFALAKRFDMFYIDENGEKVNPMIIHRSSIGSYERTLAILIEKYNGAFPIWVSPEQVTVLSLTDRTIDQAKALQARLQRDGIRAVVDVRSEKLGKKIREAQLLKIPYIAILGDKEVEEGNIAIRSRSEGDIGKMTYEDFLAKIKNEIDNKIVK